MSQPQWIDITALGLPEGVLQLFKATGARDYACSVERFVRQGWKGESCRVLVDDGFVTVHADCYCPRDTVWALEWPENSRLKHELEHARLSIADERKKRERAEKDHERAQAAAERYRSEARELRSLLSEVADMGERCAKAAVSP